MWSGPECVNCGGQGSPHPRLSLPGPLSRPQSPHVWKGEDCPCPTSFSSMGGWACGPLVAFVKDIFDVFWRLFPFNSGNVYWTAARHFARHQGGPKDKVSPQGTDRLWGRKEWKVRAQNNTKKEDSVVSPEQRKLCGNRRKRLALIRLRWHLNCTLKQNFFFYYRCFQAYTKAERKV